jgi:hypothetical protein
VNKKSRIIILIILIPAALAAVGIAYYLTNGRNPYSPKSESSDVSKPQIVINGKSFGVEVADTPQKRTQGLSGRASLPADSGMLFVFDKPDAYEFWMEGMLFGLDFIWINGDQVVDLTSDVPAPLNGTPLKTIKPKTAVDKVIEVSAGMIASGEIKIGDKVTISGF